MTATSKSETAAPEIVLTRLLDAPRARVFEVWTEAEHLAKWWGPAGLEMTPETLDLTPGGLFHYGMRAPNGQQMYGRFVYQEIVPPERLAFVSSFSDEKAGVTRHPMSKSWPLETLSVLTLAEFEGRTLLTLTGGPINCTADERATFLSNKDSVRQGFAGTFAQLEKHLAKLRAT